MRGILLFLLVAFVVTRLPSCTQAYPLLGHRNHRSTLALLQQHGSLSATTTQQQQTTTITVPPALPVQNDYPSLLHHIHIVSSFLTPQEVTTCARLAVEHAQRTGCWDSPDTERHASDATCDFSLLPNDYNDDDDDDDDNKFNELADYLQDIGFETRMQHLLRDTYSLDGDKDWEFLDLFCARYEENGVMDRLELHRDGALLSFTILLTNDFTGGGTTFDALQHYNTTHDCLVADGGVIRVKQAGDAIVHCGKLLHGADVVTSGERTVLVGFVDFGLRNQRAGVLSQACRDWGRMDEALRREKRQSRRIRQQVIETSPLWKQLRKRNPSMLSPTGAVFSSVQRRAHNTFQRRRRLEAEDRLLRSILVSDR